MEPLNFALRSEEDQNVIIGQYQNFLNSLNFPIQILIQSRKLDVMPYLDSLHDKIKNIGNELLRFHAIEYIEFIHSLTELSNIMDKKFYIVIGFDPPTTSSKGVLGNIFGKKEQSKISFTVKEWAKYTSELEQRVSLIVGGLTGMSLSGEPLDTQKTIELYYNAYNPEEARLEKLSDTDDLQQPIITAKEDHRIEKQMEEIKLPSLNEIEAKQNKPDLVTNAPVAPASPTENNPVSENVTGESPIIQPNTPVVAPVPTVVTAPTNTIPPPTNSPTGK